MVAQPAARSTAAESSDDRNIIWASLASYGAARGDIRTELDVTHLLSGSVARAGDRIAISVELINAGTGVQEWSEEFSSDLRDDEHLMSRIVARARAALDVARAQVPCCCQQAELDNLRSVNTAFRLTNRLGPRVIFFNVPIGHSGR